MQEKDIIDRLIKNNTLFNDIYVIRQKFDIVPDKKEHYGVSIDYQDIQELRDDFLNDLLDTIVEWVYDSEKYTELKNCEMAKNKSEATAASTVQRKAKQKFRKGTDDNLLV